MGLFGKIKNAVNPQIGDGYEDEYDYVDDVTTYNEQTEQQPQTTSYGNTQGALELKVVRPESYEAVTQIADHLLNHRTVVLNLEATNKETSRRILDFLSGVAYSIEGHLKRVANNTFVITPANVDVSGEQTKEQSKPAAAPTLHTSPEDTFGGF